MTAEPRSRVYKVPGTGRGGFTKMSKIDGSVRGGPDPGRAAECPSIRVSFPHRRAANGASAQFPTADRVEQQGSYSCPSVPRMRPPSVGPRRSGRIRSRPARCREAGERSRTSSKLVVDALVDASVTRHGARCGARSKSGAPPRARYPALPREFRWQASAAGDLATADPHASVDD